MKTWKDYPAAEKNCGNERLEDYSTSVAQPGKRSRVVFLCLHPYIVSVLLQAHPYLELTLQKAFYP